MPSGDGKVSFHVRDGELGTIHSCVASWNGLRSDYGLDYGSERDEAQPTFNLRTGYPEPEVFTTSDGCVYDEFSVLASEPPPDAFVDGVRVFVLHDPVDFSETTEIYLASVVINKGSRLEVRYYFDVVDSYDTHTKRARAASISDKAGEWSALEEVVSEDDSSSSATSGLFLGTVDVSRNPNSAGEGDGAVWVPGGDRLNVAYLNERGEMIADSDTSPPPTPTPAVKPTATNVPGLNGDPYRRPTAISAPDVPRRRVEVTFANTPLRSGETAVFYIRDNRLGSTESCIVEWSDIKRDLRADSWLSVVSGSPRSSDFARYGCDYNGATPLATYPRVTALVDGVEYLANLDIRGGRVSLLNDVAAGSNIRIEFYYELVDEYAANTRRARVYSSSDRQGEWVAIREVAGIGNSSAAAETYLYRGEIEISDDPASLARGDGRVRVRNRSRLSVVYYDDAGDTEPAERASVALDLPTPTPLPAPTATPRPTPTPIPATSPALLAIVALAGVAALLRRARRNRNTVN